MKRVLLVSSNLSFGFGLSADYEFLEERPREPWALQPERLAGVDAVVLDLRDVEKTAAAVRDARAASFAGPVLIVSEPGIGWSTAISDSSTQVLELPVTSAGLNHALDGILSGHGSLTSKNGRRRVGHPAGVPAPRPNDGYTATETLRHAQGLNTATADSDPPVPAQRRTSDVGLTVRQLQAIVSDLRSVADVSAALLGDAVAATAAEGGAVLVPDGHYWRVTAGIAIRHVEWRLALDQDSWLINETATQRHAVVVEGTDIARQRLAGVPLASWRQVMAAPLGETHIVVITARHAEPPFTSTDLQALVSVSQMHVAPIAEALELRELARSLNRFADLEMLD